MTLPERNHALEETKDVLIRPKLAPVQPSRFIVLVVGIVVSKLRVQELVPSPEHRSPVREHQQAAEVLDLLASQREHSRWRSFIPFVSTVPAVVVVRTVLIVVAIRPVALAVIGDEVVQSETVVGGQIVHALEGVISIGAAVRKEVVAAIDAPHQVRNHPRVTLHETADIVAKAPIPLEPRHARKSAAELIS